jgi:predicted dehydrogenase
MSGITRRDVFQGAAAMTAASYSRVAGANDRIRVGFIGLGNRGEEVHRAFVEYGDCQVAAICDLRDDYLDLAASKSRGTPARYKEYRKLLEDRSVDAVAIATPDHWHALMMIDACNAGKDVYVEKPLSLTVVEGRRMVETAARTKRVVQVGTHRRSSPLLKEVAEMVRGGAIGQVTMAKCYDVSNEWPTGIGNFPDSAPPTDWEWDQWLGPAPKVPYNRNRMYYKFRWFYNYSGGQLTNYGVHYLDMIRWCLGKESPRMVAAIGGKYAVKDNREIPDTLEVIWDFDGTLVIFTQCNANGAPGNIRRTEIELRGTKGTLYLNEHDWEIVPEKPLEAGRFARTPLDRKTEREQRAQRKDAIAPAKGERRLNLLMLHARNFLDCVKSREKCNADILTGHISTSGPLIGNIAHKTQSTLKWDAAKEHFIGNPAADRLLHYQYRSPYKLG